MTVMMGTMNMMDDPVVALALLVALVAVLGALTVGLRVLGGHDGRYRPQPSPRPPSRTTSRALQAAALRQAQEPSAEQ